MKIGILTHQYIHNFGAFLQAYALQEALKSLFPEDEVRVIDYVNVRHFLINTCGWFRFYRDRETLQSWLEKIRLPRTFSAERKRLLSLTPRCFTPAQVNALGFDHIVVGSDEVWNYADRKGRDKIKFGAGLTCDSLIAYAPSIGGASPREGVPQYVIDGLQHFRFFSARDDGTAELIKRATGRDAVRVLDPTFLAPCPAVKPVVPEKPYILFYYCDKLPAGTREQILREAGRRGMAVYGAGECDKRYTKTTVNLTPFQWVEMFRHAEFVFTGTFHGAVFSILNRRQFKVYLTNESRVKKVRALLRELGIEGRELNAAEPGFPQAEDEQIDYDKVEALLAKKRARSLSYLKAAILGRRSEG